MRNSCLVPIVSNAWESHWMLSGSRSRSPPLLRHATTSSLYQVLSMFISFLTKYHSNRALGFSRLTPKISYRELRYLCYLHCELCDIKNWKSGCWTSKHCSHLSAACNRKLACCDSWIPPGLKIEPRNL